MHLLNFSSLFHVHSASSLRGRIETRRHATSSAEPSMWSHDEVKFLLNALHSLAQLQKRDEDCISAVQPLLSLATREGALGVKQHLINALLHYQLLMI